MLRFFLIPKNFLPSGKKIKLKIRKNPTMNEQLCITKWHEDENKWWDRYSNIMAYQWKLTPFLNRIIRQDLERDFIDYLVKPGGRLLDLGCGSGWLSLKFSRNDMHVLGLDFSKAQINAAEKMKINMRLKNVKFECVDLMQWDYQAHTERFDSIFVNAFLHHLPAEEVKRVFGMISKVIKPGGRVYIYEPLKSSCEKRNLFLFFIDTLILKCIGLMLGKIPVWFSLRDRSFKKELDEGYNSLSPHEAPLGIREVKNYCLDSLHMLEVRGWHLYSLGFAMQTMFFKKRIRRIYHPMVFLFYWIDQIFFRLFGWERFSVKQRFILCGMKLEKPKI